MAWYDINGLDDELLVGAVRPVKNSVGPQYQETHTVKAPNFDNNS
jgi:hypothetical protein